MRSLSEQVHLGAGSRVGQPMSQAKGSDSIMKVECCLYHLYLLKNTVLGA